MKKRIISAVIALALVIPLLILGGIYFQLAILVIAAIAYKEIIDLKESHKPYPFIMVLLGLFCLFMIVLANNARAGINWGISYPLVVLPILLLLLPIIFFKDNKYTSKDALYLIGIVFFLGLVFNLMIVIRMRNFNTFLWLLIIPIINDMFAYFVGSKIGKHKMCPLISPKKTWEGSIAGLLIGSIVAIVFYKLFIGNIVFETIYTVVLLSIVGQAGDLVLSKIKRENNIKDFSNIMPGHGGILDRLDSIMFVIILYVVLTF